MRIATVLVSAALAACAGDDGAPTTDDGGDGDGASGPVDGGPDAPPPANEPAGLVGTVAAHNAARAEVGLPPLTWDPALAAIADAWVRQCRDTEAPTGLVDHNAGRSQGYPTYVGQACATARPSCATTPRAATSAAAGRTDSGGFFEKTLPPAFAGAPLP
jgi:hypothetical protein